LKPIFKIQVAESLSNDSKLFIEINLSSISYILIDAKNTCSAFISYQFPPDISNEKTALFIKETVSEQAILQESFAAVTIIYGYPSSIFIPSSFMENIDKKAVLELVFGDINDAYIKTNFVAKYQMHNIFTIPKQIDAVISYLFDADKIVHLSSLIPELIPFKKNHLYCIFSTNYFTVQLIKDGDFKTILHFHYKIPEDVVFYLLQLCHCHEVDQSDLMVHLSGMIDQQSTLNDELNSYFSNLKFQPLPEAFDYPNDFKKIPAHYFSYLFEMLLCV